MRKSQEKPRIVLILGSGPDALDAGKWPAGAFDTIVAINNAWQVRTDWNYLIFPEDFPTDRLPSHIDQKTRTLVTASDYVPVQNDYGGFVYAGGTMAFTAGYWALGALKPDVLAFFGCDMNYGAREGKTHFYGTGEPDPLRKDVTLQSLDAKSARLMLMGAAQDCMTINLSARSQSHLMFPRMSIGELGQLRMSDVAAWVQYQNRQEIGTQREAILSQEADLGYFVASGRYWEHSADFDAKALRDIDALWLNLATE